MSLKNAFNKGFLPQTTFDELSQYVESEDTIVEVKKDQSRILSAVNYANPSQFVRYGLAEDYYTSVFNKIVNTYPYDGSKYDKFKWLNECSDFEKWFFENEYPRVNGYITFSNEGWGTRTEALSNGFGYPEELEYIQTSNNFQSSNVYSTTTNQTDNLKFDLDEGVTFEFWLKKDGFIDTELTEKEAIFDLYTEGVPSNFHGYARTCMFFLHDSEQFLVTCQSGSSGFYEIAIGNQDFADGEWHFYSLSLKNSGLSDINMKLYVDGELNDVLSVDSGTLNEVTGSKELIIGSLGSNPNFGTTSGDIDNIGWGKLSASLDDFRFWKTEMAAKDIKSNSLMSVYGGNNSGTYNTNLAVYYKFNEGDNGITEDSAILDYSGRRQNGVWEGYSTGSRSTGSAFVLSECAPLEFQDPILYTASYLYSQNYTNFQLVGQNYDALNSSALYHQFPNWILEEDEIGESFLFKKIIQVVANYFDMLHLQMEMLAKIKQAGYLSEQNFTYNHYLLSSYGFEVDDLFVDQEVIEEISNIDGNIMFEQNIQKIKNMIYKNIFNNLSKIYKTKGSLESIKNLLNSIGIDEKILKIKYYTNNETYKLDEKTSSKIVKRKYVNFNNSDAFTSCIYQETASSPISTNIIQGDVNRLTIETELFFPKKFDKTSNFYFQTDFTTSSMFGLYAKDSSNFKVYLVKPQEDSPHCYFCLTGSAKRNSSDEVFLTSSMFYDVYEDTKWSFGLSFDTYKNSEILTSSFADGIITFYGVQSLNGKIHNSFELTSTLDNSDFKWEILNKTGFGPPSILHERKLFIGADRANCTGTIVQKSHVECGSVKVWADTLTIDEITQHNMDVENYGRSLPLKRTNLSDIDFNNTELTKNESLILHWEFNEITGSDKGGRFYLSDLSSGSKDNRHYQNTGTLTKLYTGMGDFFDPNVSTTNTRFVRSYFVMQPDDVKNLNDIDIIEQEEVTFSRNDRPSNTFISFEKSMNAVVSDDMMKMFAGLQIFNNIIGNPINIYRKSYNELEYLRQFYFEKITNSPDYEKFVDFYKWIDTSIYNMVQQLLPASAQYSTNIKNIIESHVLERPKYDQKYFNIVDKKNDPSSSIDVVNKNFGGVYYGFYTSSISCSNISNKQFDSGSIFKFTYPRE